MRSLTGMLVLLWSIAADAAEGGQPLNVKVGLWETTMTVTTSGAMPVPAELMARLTPAQRAKVEEQMRLSGEKTRTSTHKTCLSKQDLEKGPNFGQEGNQCSQLVVNSSSRRLVMRFSCQRGETNATGKITVEALSPRSVKGAAQSNINSGGHTRTTRSTFTSKWIAAGCRQSRE
ncbi:MAG: DUF3617 domain-containing protein [Acidobacteria bacterium]|nr:DUF3617 domain-containing protein [Acidobacteriota bacterium]